jgi:hypothetical protein
MTHMKTPTGYVLSGDMLFVVVGDPKANSDEVRDAALTKLKLQPEAWSTAAPATVPATVQVLDMTEAPGASPTPQVAQTPPAPPSISEEIQTAKKGLEDFYRSVHQPNAKREDDKSAEPVPGAPVTPGGTVTYQGLLARPKA